jgi:hypothetical protein
VSREGRSGEGIGEGSHRGGVGCIEQMIFLTFSLSGDIRLRFVGALSDGLGRRLCGDRGGWSVLTPGVEGVFDGFRGGNASRQSVHADPSPEVGIDADADKMFRHHDSMIAQ